MLRYSSRLKNSLDHSGRSVTLTGGSIFWPIRKRQHPRFEIPLEGLVHKGKKSVPCRLWNISAAGALIEIDTNALFDINGSLRIGHAANLEILEIGMLIACPKRVHWKFAGMAFEGDVEEVGAFINQWLEGQGQANRPN